MAAARRPRVIAGIPAPRKNRAPGLTEPGAQGGLEWRGGVPREDGRLGWWERSTLRRRHTWNGASHMPEGAAISGRHNRLLGIERGLRRLAFGGNRAHCRLRSAPRAREECTAFGDRRAATRPGPPRFGLSQSSCAPVGRAGSTGPPIPNRRKVVRIEISQSRRHRIRAGSCAIRTARRKRHRGLDSRAERRLISPPSRVAPAL